MSAKEFEKRLEVLEREVEKLKRLPGKEKVEKEPWYIKNAGCLRMIPSLMQS